MSRVRSVFWTDTGDMSYIFGKQINGGGTGLLMRTKATYYLMGKGG